MSALKVLGVAVAAIFAGLVCVAVWHNSFVAVAALAIVYIASRVLDVLSILPINRSPIPPGT